MLYVRDCGLRKLAEKVPNREAVDLLAIDDGGADPVHGTSLIVDVVAGQDEMVMTRGEEGGASTPTRVSLAIAPWSTQQSHLGSFEGLFINHAAQLCWDLAEEATSGR